MTTLTARAYAKINLWLAVGEKRADGYHSLESVMQAVSLCDLVSVTRAPDGENNTIRLHCSDPAIPSDERNIAWKCADAFFRRFGIEGANAEIRIEKHIPQAAGLAGGSSDGAAVLKLLNLLWKTGADQAELCAIGAGIGADIPFCLAAGTCVCRGKGEILSPLSIPDPSYAVLIAKNESESVSTAEAYRLLDEKPRSAKDLSVLSAGFPALLHDLGKGRLPRTLYNDFERTASGEVFRLKEKILSLGAEAALMSGSGPSVFGLFTDRAAAQSACEALIPEGIAAYAASPVSRAF